MIWTFYPIQRFADFAPEWERLNDACTSSPLLALPFVLPLIQEFSSGSELLAIGTHDELSPATGETELQPFAMMVLSRKNGFTWETFQPPQAPLGICLHRREVDWTACLTTLIARLPGSAAVLGITQQDPDIEPVPTKGDRLEIGHYIRTARISVCGTFEEYWKARGKNLRQNLRKQRQKLERDGIATRLDIVTAPDEVGQAIADYARLESAGWKAAEGTAIRADNDQGRFYTAMLAGFCRLGKGEIYRYWYNERLVAMDLCIEDGGVLVVLKTTYDEQTGDGTSPALLMRQDALMEIFQEGRLGRVEFYGRVMDWHTRWTDEIRTMYHLTAYRWPILRTVRGLMKKMG